jgi:hypothetical protein
MSQFDPIIAQTEQKYGLPPGILAATAAVESHYNPNAVSPQGAVGLMQILPSTAHSLGVDPRDPAQAIDGAGRLWQQNLKASGGDIDKAAMMYHGGPDTRQWGPKTHAYPQKLAAALGPSQQPQPGGGDPIEAALSGQPAQAAPAPQSPSADPHDPIESALSGGISASNASPGPGIHSGGAAGQGSGGGNSVPDNGGGRNPVGAPQGAPGQPQGTPSSGLQPHQLGIVPGAIDAGLSGYTAGLVHPVTAALNTILPLDKLTNPNVKSIWDSSLPDAFKNNLAIENGGNQQFRQDHPGISIGSDVGGAVFSPFNKLFAPSEGASLTQRIGNYMLQGGAYGGVRGASDGGTTDAAAIGTGLGMALGPAGAAVGNVAGKVLGAALKSPAFVRDLISSTSKAKIASMIDNGASVDQIHDAIPDSKTIAHIGDWVQYRANGGKAKVTFGEPAPSEVVNDPTPAETSAPAPQAAAPQDQTPIIIKGKKLAAALGTQGSRRGIEATTDLPPQVSNDVQRLTQAGVSPEEAQREADINYVGGKPTVAAVTRNPSEQWAFNEGAKDTSTPTGQQLNDVQATNNRTLHATTNQTVDSYGGAPEPGEAAQSAAKTLANASDAELGKVNDLYKQADEQAAQQKQVSATDTAQRQSQADAQAAKDAQAKARQQLDDAQQSYKASKTDVNVDTGKALKDLQAARDNLRAVTDSPPKAAPVPSRTAPGYIDLSPLQQALATPEMANPATEGLRALVNGAKGYINTLSNGTGRVSAQDAESVRQYLNSAYDPLGGPVNNAIGKLKSILDSSMDNVPNAPQAYKTARAAYSKWASQYDNPTGVQKLIQRDAQGNFLHSDSWRNIEDRLHMPSNDAPLIQVTRQLQKLGANDALNKLKAGIVSRAYDAATNSAGNKLGDSVFNGKLFQKALNNVGAKRLGALFSPDEIAHLATIGRAARHLNEPVPGTINTSSTGAAVNRSSLAKALQAKPGSHPVLTGTKLILGASGHIPLAAGIHGAEALSRRAAAQAVAQGTAEQLNPGLARAMAARSEQRIQNSQFVASMGRALSKRGAAPAANDVRAKAIGRKLSNAF